MTMYFANNYAMNTSATQSAAAASACANFGRTEATCAHTMSLTTILDTIAMVSIFVALVVGLSLVLGLSILSISLILICLLVLAALYFCIPFKEHPQPI